MNLVKIIYSGFYDVPLAFTFSYRSSKYLFLREFDDELDDYTATYKVYSLPDLSDAEIEKSWQRIDELATRYLGEVAVNDVIFDSSKRREIDPSIVDALPSEKTPG